VVGIDGAGKSTIVNQVKPQSSQRSGEQPPTIGCNFEDLKIGGTQLTVVDMAGGSKYRNMWHNYYGDADGVIFVIDSADSMRLCGPQPHRPGMPCKCWIWTAWRSMGVDDTRTVWGPRQQRAACACRAVAKEEMQEMLAHEALKRNAPLLILASKMDLPKSMSHQALAEGMDLASISPNHAWRVMHCCGLTGEGVHEAWDWLLDQLARIAAAR
jgi:ADP-ribosylation factor-like protein 6